MTTAQILATAGATKTWKMQQLFALGHTRREVATLLGVGYGFAQNVYAAWIAASAERALVTPSRTAAQQALAPFAPGPFNRTFGVEIEAFGVTSAALLAELRAQGLEAQAEGYNHTTRGHWKITSDASISGPNAFELVSPVLQGLEGLADLERACRALRICGAQVNSTCGLHVHLGARDLSIEAMRQLVRNYLVLEPTIDQLMPADRRGDAAYYCRSLQRGRTLAAAEQAILSATTAQELGNAANTNRYHKVNMQSFFRQGTIEFRQHSGTTNFEKISMWVRFLANLVDFSKQRLVTPALPVSEFATFNQRDIATFYQRRRTALATRTR
ncbi:amidoligase family protein [Hymenobacter sp. 5317J-9]|uniref:amidoligase family protein n=1 Tax=Hymenobacter sp. 5317J-9 TaxID=2932250 RepID=UPI001FD673DB|nr:amidoligase family protein [Hymenobacter sp. 5317J-9]UOQ99909.1 amidoligase family protein [Hymenobacter sp. 5317J-9]